MKNNESNNMKSVQFVLLLFLLSPLLCLSQNSESFYAGELSKMINIPNSPEAEAFTKYGDHQVSLYSGIPQISLPIYTIKGREFNLPIGLTYDASGVKVEQIATNIGLGWNLNIGGRVTRITNGNADDYIASNGGYTTIDTYDSIAKIYPVVDNIKNAILYADSYNGNFPTVQKAEQYFSFLDDLIKDRTDAQPDYYSINAPGISGTMVLDLNNSHEPKVLNNPRIIVTRTTNEVNGPTVKWTITNEDGTKYYFEEMEETERFIDFSVTNYRNIHTKYVSSWLLTRIVSSNGKDEYDFIYDDNTTYWQQEQQTASTESTNTLLNGNGSGDGNDYPYTPGTRSSTKYWLNQPKLLSVLHNSDTVITVDYGNRHDIDNDARNTRIAGLNFFDLYGTAIKSVDFDNDHYFNRNTSIAVTAENPYDIRMKLEGFSIKGAANGTYKTHTFEYEQPDNLPPRDSYSQDYFGYYNGANNASINTLIPRYDIGSITIEGADREPEASFARIGLLKKITYPTKGYTEFEFEGHDMYKSSSVTGTETMLTKSLPDGVTVHDPALYTNAGGTICLDAYDDPLITIVNFFIPEAGDYKISYTGSSLAEAGYRVYTDISGGINYCNFRSTGTPFYNASNGSSEVSKPFVQGKHQAILVTGKNGNGIYPAISLSITRQVLNSTSGNIALGGIRIKEIRDYSGPNQLATTKAYNYRTEQGRSLGRVNYIPSLWSTHVSVNTSTNSAHHYLTRKASYPKGNAPYVVYPEVKVSQLDVNGNALGYVKHRFYDQRKGITPQIVPPYENNYFPNLKGGELKKNITYDTNNEKKASQDVVYEEIEGAGFVSKGWVAYAIQEPVEKTLYLMEYNTHDPATYFVSYRYMESWTCQGEITSPSLNALLCAAPPYISNTSLLCDGIANCGITLMNPDYAKLRGRKTVAPSIYGGVSAVRDTVYFKDVNDLEVKIVTAKLTEDYDSAIDYLPRKTTTIDSKGDKWVTTNTYPKDLNVIGAQDLINKNNLVAQLKTETIKNPSTENISILSQEIEYLKLNASTVLPKKVKTSKGNTAVENRGEFAYYADGNLKSSKKEKGMETVYVWGYDSTYPIAKIENATFTSNKPNTITVAQQALIDDVVLATIDEKTIVTENTLRSKQKLLQEGFPNAIVSTYTYDPSVGVTSMTDPRGYTIYYIYDEFHRLKEVRDADNNLVTDYEYNYKEQSNQ